MQHTKQNALMGHLAASAQMILPALSVGYIAVTYVSRVQNSAAAAALLSVFTAAALFLTFLFHLLLCRGKGVSFHKLAYLFCLLFASLLLFLYALSKTEWQSLMLLALLQAAFLCGLLSLRFFQKTETDKKRFMRTICTNTGAILVCVLSALSIRYAENLRFYGNRGIFIIGISGACLYLLLSFPLLFIKSGEEAKIPAKKEKKEDNGIALALLSGGVSILLFFGAFLMGSLGLSPEQSLWIVSLFFLFCLCGGLASLYLKNSVRGIKPMVLCLILCLLSVFTMLSASLIQLSKSEAILKKTKEIIDTYVSEFDILDKNLSDSIVSEFSHVLSLSNRQDKLTKILLDRHMQDKLTVDDIFALIERFDLQVFNEQETIIAYEKAQSLAIPLLIVSAVLGGIGLGFLPLLFWKREVCSINKSLISAIFALLLCAILTYASSKIVWGFGVSAVFLAAGLFVSFVVKTSHKKSAG